MRVGTILKKGAELAAAVFFAVMFGAFLLQVFMRYVMNDPLTWTLELCLIAYVWIVFWSCAFLLRERDHVAFNLFYASAPPWLRRVLALTAAVAILVSFLAALPATYDFISFMAIDTTWVLEIRFDVVFAVFLLFMVAVIVRAGLHVLRLVRDGWRDEI